MKPFTLATGVAMLIAVAASSIQSAPRVLPTFCVVEKDWECTKIETFLVPEVGESSWSRGSGVVAQFMPKKVCTQWTRKTV